MGAKKSIKILLIMLTLIGLASLLPLPAVAAPKWAIPDGIKTIEVDGYDMAYQETGSGIPLVLIPGSLSDYRTWDTQVPDFSKAYRTIAVSPRHHYPEKWNGIGDDYSVALHAADVAAMIKKLNLGKVHLLGHSRGGSIAVTVASRSPEVIRTLILEEANMEPLMPETAEKQKRTTEAEVRQRGVRANLATGNREKAAREWVASMGGVWEKVQEGTQKNIVENIEIAAADSGDRGKFSCADIQKFNFPILLLNAMQGQKLYSDMNVAMRQCKPDIPAPIIVPNTGHNMHRENPAAYNKVVLDFLKHH